VVLLHDHRSFGVSDGEESLVKRSTWIEIEDSRLAPKWLQVFMGSEVYPAKSTLAALVSWAM
jgi:hypothetical protein